MMAGQYPMDKGKKMVPRPGRVELPPKEAGGDLPAEVKHDVFLQMDEQETKDIIAEITMGRAAEAMVYSFLVHGKPVYGLSVKAAEECKRHLASRGEVIEIDSLDLHIPSMGEGHHEEAVFRAKGSRWAVRHDEMGERRVQLDNMIVLVNQAKWMHRQDGRTTFNEHWLRVGQSKAIRNLILHLVPETIKQKAIEYFMSMGKTKAVPSGPALDRDRAATQEEITSERRRVAQAAEQFEKESKEAADRARGTSESAAPKDLPF